MKFASSIQKWFSNRLKITSFMALAVYIAGTIGLYLLILLNAKLFAHSIPLLAVGLSWFWFLLPGFLLSQYFAPDNSWWERIPIGFVITIGIATPFTVGAILLHISLDLFAILHMCSLILAAAIMVGLYLTKKFPEKPGYPHKNPTPDGYRRASTVLLILFIAICLVLAFLAFKWPLTGDDTAILPLFSDVLDQNRITGVEPFHGSEVPVTPRNELTVATYLEILTNKVSGVSPQEFIVNSRPFLVIIAILSLATLLNHSNKDKRQNVFLLCIWGIYLLATLKADNTGSDFITRIFQDKFLGWFIIVPIALLFMLKFMETRRWKNLAAFGLVTLGASMVHPITLTQVMILSAGFGIFHYASNHTKAVFQNLVRVAVILLICTLIPFVQYIRYTNYMPVDLVGLGDAVEFGRLSASVGRYRLWLLNKGRFILHPSIILQPIILAAYALLPVLITKLRHNHLAQLITGGMVLLPVLLYVPPFAALAGKVVTPYLLWRLAWPFPLFSVLAIGSVLWLIALKIDEKLALRGYRPSKIEYLYPGIIILVLLTGAVSIGQGVKDYTERRTSIYESTCQKAGDVFRYLAQITRDSPANVFSSHNLNLCIPGYASNANVIEYRGYGTINRLSYDNIEESIQRVEDVDYFSGAKLFDDLLLKALNLHKIDYVLVEKDQLDLDLQFKYFQNYFKPVFEDKDFRLYSVQNIEETVILVKANTALRQNQYDSATELYLQVLEEDPENILANLGLGRAEEGLGNNNRAIENYHMAIRFAPGEPALHAQLASVYLLMREFEKSVKEYQIAIKLSPERADLHSALGEIYVLLGQSEDAKISFENYASLKAVKGSANYYSLLGNALQSINSMKNQAILYQEKAISIQPETRRSINLARTWILSGETDTAIKILEQALRQDRWNYLPHLELGYIFWNQGDIEQAIREFETACRLNPANVSAYIVLAKAIQEKEGTAAAIAKLEALGEINRVLPGPYRSLAIVKGSSGEFNSAMDAIERSASIQPKNASVLTSKGYISMIAGQMDIAFEAFDQALTTYPDLISAILGLGMYYNIEANYELEAGQFHDIVKLVPTASWIHLVIGEMYRQRADFTSALDEINWAIRLDPNNPDAYIARGDILNIQSNWSLAISDYTIAGDLDPQNYTALLRLGEAYESRANYTKAEELYARAVDFHPDLVNPKIQLADLYWKLGRIDEAETLEAEIQKLAPNSSLVLIRLANSYENQGKIEQARTIFNEIIQNSPNLIAAHISLAQLMEEDDNDLTMVYSVYGNLLENNQSSAEVYLATGKFLNGQGQYELGEQILTASLSYPDVSADNYLTLSELQLKLGRRDKAFATLEKAIKFFPGDAALLCSLGFYYLDQVDLTNAVHYFDKAIDLDPAFFDAYTGKSQIEQINGDKDRAARVMQMAVSKNPGSPEALIALSRFQESTGNVELAEASINRALEINPSNFSTNQAAGLFFLHQKRFPEAYERFQTALALPGPNLEVYLQLGVLVMAQGQLEEGIRWYQTAKLEGQSDIRPYLALSEVYQKKGDFQKALASLFSAYQLKPANVEVNIALGEFFSRVGNSTDARAYFERAISLDQSNPATVLALAELDKGEGRWSEATSRLELAASIDQTNFQFYYSLAETYQIMGDCPRAEFTLTTGIQKTIDKQAGYLGVADIYERCGNWQAAQEYYELAWMEKPDSPQGGWILIDYFRRRNDIEQALTALSRIESLVGSNSEVLVEYGNIYTTQARWPEAETAYQNALKLDPKNEDAYLGLGKIFENQGKFDDAIKIYQTAAENLDKSGNIQLRLGANLQKQGKFGEARTAYQKAVDLDAFNFSNLINQQQLDLVLGNLEEAPKLYINQAIEAPNSVSLTTIGQLYQKEGEWVQSYAWLQRAVHNEPLNGENWFFMGNYYRSLGRWDEALESYALANKLAPGSSTVLVSMGQVQEEIGLFDDAQKSYRQALDTQPGDSSGYAALARLQLKIGEPATALQTIQAGIRSAPADYRGYETLGDIYRSIYPDHIEQAEAAYRSGLIVLPGSPELYTKVGDLYNNQAAALWAKYTAAREYENWAKNQYQNLIHQIGTEEEFALLPRFLQQKLDEATQAYEQSRGMRAAAQKEYESAELQFTAAEENYLQALAIDSVNVQALTGMGKLRMAQGLDAEAGSYFEKAYALNPFSGTALNALGDYYQNVGQMDKALTIFEQANELEPTNRAAQSALTNVLHDLPAVSISQVTRSIEQSSYKLEALVLNLRQEEIQ